MLSDIDRRMTVANILPPFFICSVVGTIWAIYLCLHLAPMLQLSSATVFDVALYRRGVWQTLLSQALTAMFAICFAQSVMAQPGTVPNEPEWMPGPKGSLASEVSTRELKGSTGDRRFCKWCQKYKPDRCHHCRICKRCVLRMDHHCPWIMNCVGFRNHKYFFLLVVYAVLNCIFITVTMLDSVQRSVEQETSATNRFLLVLGLTLSSIMGVLMASFLSFHTWLMFKGMTTIEFCEKNLSGASNSLGATGADSGGVSYNLGFHMNVKAVLGPRWHLWFLPVSLPEGTGISFPSAATMPNRNFYEEAEPEWTGNEKEKFVA